MGFVRKAAVALCALAAIALAGCGGGDGGGGGGKSTVAALVPTDAPLFAEATVRPEGDLRSGAEDAAGKLLATDDPGARIADLLDQALESSNQTYDADVKPWLGERAAVWFATFTDKPDGAFIVEATDTGAGLDAVRKTQEASTSESASEHSYKGVDYSYYPNDDTAIGAVENAVVIGSKEGFEGVVDVSNGAPSMAGAGEYSEAISNAPADRLATLYLDPKGLFDALVASGQIPDVTREQIDSRLGEAARQPLIADLTATSDQVSFEVTGGRPPAELGGDGNSLLTELPGDSWAAIGLSDLGTGLGQGIKQLGSIPGAESLPDQIGAQTGLDLESIASWLGDVALFGRGTDLQSLGGGAVAQSTDQAASKRDIAQISKAIERASNGQVAAQALTLPGGGDGVTLQITGFPIPILFAQRSEKVVFALGTDAAQQAFSPSDKLGDSSEFDRAGEALGGSFEVGGFVSLQPILDLVENLGAGSDPGYLEAKPYLENIDFLVYGSGGEGGGSSARVVLGLR